MQDEIHEFDRLQVWELVPRPDYVMIIALKWIYKVKLDEYGDVLKNKAAIHCHVRMLCSDTLDEDLSFQTTVLPSKRFLCIVTTVVLLLSAIIMSSTPGPSTLTYVIISFKSGLRKAWLNYNMADEMFPALLPKDLMNYTSLLCMGDFGEISANTPLAFTASASVPAIAKIYLAWEIPSGSMINQCLMGKNSRRNLYKLFRPFSLIRQIWAVLDPMIKRWQCRKGMEWKKRKIKKTASTKQPKSKSAIEKLSKPAPASKPKPAKEKPSKPSTAKPPKPKPAKATTPYNKAKQAIQEHVEEAIQTTPEVEVEGQGFKPIVTEETSCPYLWLAWHTPKRGEEKSHRPIHTPKGRLARFPLSPLAFLTMLNTRGPGPNPGISHVALIGPYLEPRHDDQFSPHFYGCILYHCSGSPDIIFSTSCSSSDRTSETVIGASDSPPLSLLSPPLSDNSLSVPTTSLSSLPLALFCKISSLTPRSLSLDDYDSTHCNLQILRCHSSLFLAWLTRINANAIMVKADCRGKTRRTS
ncbi:hypothetical protein Tco_1069116 [Tanacetum coccineum]|uniref:Uncharacterized protein n=1 Tax=Tanacetum coccineum TaxID=301880 RepID=A0ABQ5HHU6_9ASTR